MNTIITAEEIREIYSFLTSMWFIVMGKYHRYGGLADSGLVSITNMNDLII